MIQKITALLKDKSRIEKLKKPVANIKKSIEDYFFLRGVTIKKIWIPTAAVVLCGTVFLLGTNAVKVDAVDSIPVAEENLIEAYAVYYRGEHIGIVENKDQADAILNSIQQDFQEQYRMETMLNENIEVEKIMTESRFLSNLTDIKKIVASSIDVKVKAAVLQIDGKDIAVLKDEDSIQRVLERVKEPYKKAIEEEGNALKDIAFEENVEIKYSYVNYSAIENEEEVYKKLIGETEEKQIYTVQEGDTLWDIARAHDMTVEEILQANSMKETDLLKIGMELNLVVPEKQLNVVTVEEIRYTEEIPFETETQKSDSLYTDQTKVVQEGQKGEREIVAKIKRYNGVEKEREIVSETVTKEPVNKVVMKGTKSRPSKVVASRGSGTFIWPTRGRISSRFGQRWGRLHAGIDIANSKGTPIYAAASGTVTFAGYSGSYGKLVKISHGNGLETRYGHMSSIAVSSGSKVKQGQLIGYMGSTGRSTGSHLHFEVRVNGKAVNPLKYLK